MVTIESDHDILIEFRGRSAIGKMVEMETYIRATVRSPGLEKLKPVLLTDLYYWQMNMDYRLSIIDGWSNLNPKYKVVQNAYVCANIQTSKLKGASSNILKI